MVLALYGGAVGGFYHSTVIARYSTHAWALLEASPLCHVLHTENARPVCPLPRIFARP